MPTCIILALDNSPLSSATGPLEAWLLAARLAGRSDWQVQIAAEDGLHIRGQGGLQLSAHTSLPAVEQADVVLIAAIGDPRLRQPLQPATVQHLQRLYAQGAELVSLCSGAYVLASTGLLDGQPATSHWQLTGWLQQQFPQVQWQPEALLTHAGRLRCAGGAGAWQDMLLRLIAEYFGPAVAQQTARLLLIDPDRQSQLPYRAFNPLQAHNDKKILAVQQWLDEHACEALTLAQLASRIHLSERQFKRRFTAAVQQAPLAYIQELRMERARQALAGTRAQVEQIARTCGYDDVRFFRRLFRRSTGLTPQEYRQKFSTINAT